MANDKAEPYVVQEVAKGAVLGPISSLEDTYRAVVHPTQATAAQLKEALAFVDHMEGTEYGWISILGDALDDLTGLHLTLGTTGRLVCSALVARAYERLGLIPNVEPSMVQPADFAIYFGL